MAAEGMLRLRDRRWVCGAGRALGKRSSEGRTGAGCGPVGWGWLDGLYARLTTKEGFVGFGVNEDLRRMDGVAQARGVMGLGLLVEELVRIPS